MRAACNLSTADLDAAGIFRRFHGATLDSFDVSTPERHCALTTSCEWLSGLDAGRCGALWIVGGVGAGKTHLAVAVARAWAEHRGCTLRLATAREIVRALRATWRPDSVATEAEVLAKYGECGLLVLDDLAQGFNSEAEALQLGEVIDRRYACNLPTVVISSLNRAEVAAVIGERTYDRLNEAATVVVCDWPSHRTQVANI